MQRRMIVVTFALFCLLPMIGSCVLGPQPTGKSDQDLKVRMKQVEDEVATMRDEYNRTAGSVADTVAAFDQLQSKVGVIEGKFDETTFAANKYSQDYQELRSYLDDEFKKIDKRLSVLEAKAGIKNAEGISVVPTNLQGKPKSDEDLFKEAENTFKQGDYESARGKFKEFIAAYPKSSKADHSQFYIAETFFKQKDYENAILEYSNVMERYKKSSFVVKSLFKIGVSFQELGQNKDAKTFLNRVINEYPGSPEAQMAKKKIEQIH